MVEPPGVAWLSHSLQCNERASSFRAVSIAGRLVCPVRAVIRSRLAAAVGESITCNLVSKVPSTSLSARFRHRRCRSAVLIGLISYPPFRCWVTGDHPATTSAYKDRQTMNAMRMVSVYPVDKFYASIPAVSVFDAATA